jgi:hypothetical protein
MEIEQYNTMMRSLKREKKLEEANSDLLAALEACLHRLDEHDDQSAPECLMARAAIAKATGGVR